VISTVALCLNTLTQFQYVDANGNVKVVLLSNSPTISIAIERKVTRSS
jgi:hypothetical protein